MKNITQSYKSNIYKLNGLHYNTSKDLVNYVNTKAEGVATFYWNYETSRLFFKNNEIHYIQYIKYSKQYDIISYSYHL